MAEHMEKLETAERIMTPELRNQRIESYMEFSREAAAGGHRDMAEYYHKKANELENNAGSSAERLGTAGDQQSCEAGRDMKAYYEARKQRILEEKQQREQQWRMDKAVHGTPRYAGVDQGWSESEYIYEAEKEYAKNGNSAEYRRLLDGAAKAHVRKEYGGIIR